jgi:hypothetical protein
MVGHTHEDIDQMFSRIAYRLLSMDMFSMEKMADEITKSFKAEGLPIEVVVGLNNVSFYCYCIVIENSQINFSCNFFFKFHKLNPVVNISFLC